MRTDPNLSPRSLPRRLLVPAFALLAACGSSSGSSPTAPRPQLLIAGQYDIVRQQTSNECGPITTPMPLVGSVTHQGGGRTFTLDDGGATFSGTVDPAGGFTTATLDGTNAGGVRIVANMAGRFRSDGFDSELTLDHGTSAICRIVQRWTATKRGAPNVIPG